MLRYFAYVFIVAMAVILAAIVAFLLVGGLAGRIESATDRRLTVFDAVAVPTPAGLRGQAVLEDLGHDRPVSQASLYFHFPDGYMDAGWINKRGIAVGTRRGGLPEGRYPYEAFVSELTGSPGLRATGAVWVRPPKTKILWVDADALLALPGRSADGGPAGIVPETLATLKDLAFTRQLVYLVAADVGNYRATRQRLADAPLPPGPAWWVEPLSEPQSLASLKRTWPSVEAAIVASSRLAEAAGPIGLMILTVPAADAEGVPPAGTVTWPDVGRRLSAKTNETNAKERN